MALPSSGRISLVDLKNHFGGNSRISLSDYYSGGSFVPAGTTGASGAIPASGRISLRQFLNATIPEIVKNYVFTPYFSYSAGGTASASNGMPSDYNPSVHGSVIWPVSSGEGGGGWVGTKIKPTTNRITLCFTADNNSSIYVDSTHIFSTSDWGSWHFATLDVVANQQLAISAYVSDAGSRYGFAGYITDNGGNILTRTSGSWVST